MRIRVYDSSKNELNDVRAFLQPEICFTSRNREEFSPTSVAVKSIQPGRKYIWIEKNGKKIAEQKATIRIDGTDSIFFIDLLSNSN